MSRRIQITALVPFLIFSAFLLGCNDAGTEPEPLAPLSPLSPIVSSVTPDSVGIGDVITIKGRNFGASRGTSSVKIGGSSATEFLSWVEIEIRTKVPEGAKSGSVEVIVNGVSSNLVSIKIGSGSPGGISFAGYVLPLFRTSCVSCHGGINNLFLDSYASLMAGRSTNGPVVLPGNGEGSYLIRMLRGTVPGKPRMPQGGPFFNNQRTDSISMWIQQGALNN